MPAMWRRSRSSTPLARERRDALISGLPFARQESPVLPVSDSAPQSESLADRHKRVLALAREKKFDAARQLAEDALASFPEDADSMALLAAIASEQGDPEAAETWLTRAIETRPDAPQVWANLGRHYQRLGRFGDAEALYERALTHLPDAGGLAFALGKLKQRRGLFAEAEPHFVMAEKAIPDEANISMHLGMVLLRQEKVEEAIAAFRRAIERDPSQGAPYGNLGNAYQKLGDLEQARAAYQEAARLSPNDASSYVSLALVTLRQGDARTAADMMERCLKRMGPERRAAAWLPFARAEEFGEMPMGYRAELGRLIKRVTLAVPEGYASVEAFNAALADAVLADPTLTPEPLAKSTRRGRQTGLLSDQPAPAFAAFETSLRAAIDAYFDTLKAEPKHPFLAQVPRDYDLDIWGTVLTHGGHQESHIHVAGWMSGVYYVAAPKGSTDTPQEGWIEFGYPPSDFEATFKQDGIAYEPQEGTALFFPSYLYHRTVPYEGDAPRISIAFDLRPKSWR